MTKPDDEKYICAGMISCRRKSCSHSRLHSPKEVIDGGRCNEIAIDCYYGYGKLKCIKIQG